VFLEYNYGIMLKIMAVLAVILTVAQASAPVPGQATNENADKGTAAHSKPDQTKGNGNAPAPVPSKPTADKPKSVPEPSSSHNHEESVTISETAAVPGKRDWFDCASLVMTFILIFITGAGVAAAWRGLPAIIQQAISTRTAAEAARDNTKALIDSERAWIIVKVDGDILCGAMKAMASNQGRTPATIVSWEYGYDFVTPEGDWKLPVPPDYFSPMPWMEGILVAPSNQFPAIHAPDAIYNALIGRESGLFQLCIYGRIIYWDTFSAKESKDKPRETRWCFRFRADARDYIPYGGEYDGAT
jgi:hypothetical protein